MTDRAATSPPSDTRVNVAAIAIARPAFLELFKLVEGHTMIGGAAWMNEEVRELALATMAPSRPLFAWGPDPLRAGPAAKDDDDKDEDEDDDDEDDDDDDDLDDDLEDDDLEDEDFDDDLEDDDLDDEDFDDDLDDDDDEDDDDDDEEEEEEGDF